MLASTASELTVSFGIMFHVHTGLPTEEVAFVRLEKVKHMQGDQHPSLPALQYHPATYM